MGRNHQPTVAPGKLARPGELTLLERDFPITQLSLLAEADRRATDPVYAAHRWWARRPPALLRGLILAAALSAETTSEQFWASFGNARPVLEGLRVLDPFAGGGSTLVEAARLGAEVSGCDVDPLAVEIIRHELNPASADDVCRAGLDLLAHLRTQVGNLYPPGPKNSVPLHYFWLHEVTCPRCGHAGPLYRNLILARDPGKVGAVVRDDAITVFCPEDFSLHRLDKADRQEFRHNGRRWKLNKGTFVAGRYTCPSCMTRSSHHELQTGTAPRRLIAIEDASPGARRMLRAPTHADGAAVRSAAVRMTTGAETIVSPTLELTLDRHDQRPLSFGITTAAQLFTDRQLLVLGTAMQWVRQTQLDPAVRRAMTLAVSNALATNNKLCSYATDYGRLSALFSVRGYPLPALPVELNPLHPDGGRGTLRQCIERVARSASDTVRRYVWDPIVQAPAATGFCFTPGADGAHVVCSPADSPPNADNHADLCLFDPPYFDYIAYSELSEFYRAWLPMSTLAGNPLLPRGADPAEQFGLDLAAALRANLRQLRPGRPIAFTYHSANPDAWRAIAVALDDAKLAVTALWPIRSDGHMGHHSHPGNCEWDLVVCCRPITETTPATFTATIEGWQALTTPLDIGDADRASMALAIAITAPRFATLSPSPSLEEHPCDTR